MYPSQHIIHAHGYGLKFDFDTDTENLYLRDLWHVCYRKNKYM